jgi:hypothetical protein
LGHGADLILSKMIIDESSVVIATRGGLERKLLDTLMVTVVITTRGGLERYSDDGYDEDARLYGYEEDDHH